MRNFFWKLILYILLDNICTKIMKHDLLPQFLYCRECCKQKLLGEKLRKLIFQKGRQVENVENCNATFTGKFTAMVFCQQKYQL